MSIQAVRLIINGIVQGVGFRPTVYQLAHQLSLYGWIKNTSNGVEIVLQTDDSTEFINLLYQSLPRLAQIDSIKIDLIDLKQPLTNFSILASAQQGINYTLLPSDSATCQDCLTELFDPNSRYYLYPLINCTNCGPRYSVIKQLPYDRASTSLANFNFCWQCQQEYSDPHNRRYHAQATACAKCGPQFNHANWDELAKLIKHGAIVAIKGVGGFVLVADASNANTVARLRQRKNRPAKPFAVMALNCTSIEANLAQIRTKQEFELLNSPTAPIVLLPRLANSIIVPEVAPNLAYLGVMLANNPWHYLLFYYLLGQPSGLDWLKQSNSLGLIVTSANFSGGTIISDNYEAEQSLASIADYIVAHDRDIIMKSDDSLVEFIANQAIYLRRSRGLAPQPFQFNYTMPSVLGLGCQLKNSITFIRNNQAFVSQYLGDMASVYTIDYFKQVLAHYQQIFSFTPQLVVSDLHPDAYVTIYAQQLGIETLTLQHHFAHFASVIANAQSYQRNLENSLLGCILDGYGYGDDGEAWGGELIHYSMSDVEFKLISQLPSLRIIGGDIAELEPWRIALAWCVEYNLAIPEYLLANRQANLVVELIKQKHGNLTTSLGRNFSGIAALLNVITQVSYEGQAAMVLESLVTTPIVAPDLIYLDDKLRPNLADLIKLVYQIGVIEQDSITAINIFYGSLAKMLAMWISQHAKILNISQVAISGGCWQSKYLLALVSEHLANLAIELIIPQNLPVNDECISFGQAWYGAQLLLKRGNKI